MPIPRISGGDNLASNGGNEIRRSLDRSAAVQTDNKVQSVISSKRGLVTSSPDVKILENIKRPSSKQPSHRIPLELPFNGVFALNLNRIDPFTRMTFKEMIEDSLKNKRDYIFIVFRDAIDVAAIHDAVSFCTLNTQTPIKINLFTNAPIRDARLYIVPKEMDSIENLNHFKIPVLCTLDDLRDENKPYFDHKIALSDPYLHFRLRQFYEYLISLDYQYGKGVQRDLDFALKFALEKAYEGNPYCQYLIYEYIQSGMRITTRTPEEEKADFWYQKATSELGTEELEQFLTERKPCIPINKPYPQTVLNNSETSFARAKIG